VNYQDCKEEADFECRGEWFCLKHAQQAYLSWLDVQRALCLALVVLKNLDNSWRRGAMDELSNLRTLISEAQAILIEQLMRFVARNVQDPGPQLLGWALAVDAHASILRKSILTYLDLPADVKHDKEKMRQAFGLSVEDCEQTDAKIHELAKLHKLGEL
jgi:hypothetical protein